MPLTLSAHIFPETEIMNTIADLSVGQKKEIQGLSGSLRSFWIAECRKYFDGPIFVITPNAKTAEVLADELKLLTDTPVFLLPDLDTLPFERISPSRELVGGRLRTLAHLETINKKIVIASARAAARNGISKDQLMHAQLRVRKNKEVSRDDLIRWLTRHGYVRVDIVGERGECAVRGGIVDFYPPHLGDPLRAEYEGDGITSLRLFDVATQTKLGELEEVHLLPAREFWLTEEVQGKLKGTARGEDPIRDALQDGIARDGMEYYFPFTISGMKSMMEDYVTPQSLLILDDPLSILASLAHTLSEIERIRKEESGFIREALPLLSQPMQNVDAFNIHLGHRKTITLTGGLKSAKLPPLPQIAEEVQRKLHQGFRIIFMTQFPHRVESELKKNGIPCQMERQIPENSGPGIFVYKNRLEEGFGDERKKFALWTDCELFPGTLRPSKSAEAVHMGVDDSLIAHLKPGDYAVHEEYGIGRYLGLHALEWDGEMHEYILLEYAEDESLYVPLHQFDLVKPYRVQEGYHPKLDHLGGSSWQRTKAKVAKGVRKLTQELIEIHAARKSEPGFAYPPDSPWQGDLEQSFPYEETRDQIVAAKEIKGDMESERPMDRLLCGDVGYGKTEVALRAAFKAATAGKQVAVLVPTTILAEQHHRTFMDRLQPFPVRVEMLSRFRNPSEQASIIEQLATGGIDIIIGTHRLFQKDIQFKDLGLLIIDEEHRFGVAHKERLKKLRRTVDVLTLTATPIPRTLHLSLSGAQDISQIATPPKDRSPIHTYIVKRNDTTIREAIQKEVERGGQIFFVHNRVETIFTVADHIRNLVPEAHVIVGHGQMPAKILEEVMAKFITGKEDVLISTSIIESGLDLPNANTIIIDNATHFGLAELYQLRGRVGRSSVRAYAYLLYDPAQLGTGTVLERLQALQEFTALGSGYKLAMRDLEIRGAGNILGREQHGHMVAVGFDLYCQMLEEAVEKLMGKKDASPVHALLDIRVPVSIPPSYIPDEAQRVATYQRIGKLRNVNEVELIAKELRDRFGQIPRPVRVLLGRIRIKLLASEKGITKIRQIGDIFIFEQKDRRKEISCPLGDAEDLIRSVEQMVGQL